MNIRKKTISSRVIAFVTAAVFILYNIPFNSTDKDAKAAGNYAKDKDVVIFPSVSEEGVEPADVTHDDTLYDNGNGTYTFKSSVWASYSFSDESQTRARTQDGYFQIKKAGSYLVELWGGDGGKGSSLPLSKPGNGGKGGFVYGVLNVTGDMIGKKLYYEVGSNGKSITRSVDDGGSGGIGGGAGKITLISVGAGGGYSALYLLDDDDIDSNGVIKESSKDNPDKVLMIAGGGGGGGASSNPLPVPVGTPDGGDGGTIDTLQSATTLNGFNGIYYAGKNGSSSGKKSTFTGKGGTDVPGEVNQSVLGLFEASAYPNDWLCSYHPDGDRGAGGAGNLRGGGGGAGFAGGSGGLQLTAVAAEDVGGGGGGSSYITTRPGLITPWRKTNNEEINKYFTENNLNSGVGGSVIIRYIPTGTSSYDYLDSNVTISGKISEYFEIVDQSPGVSVNKNADNDTFSVTDLIGPENTDKITLGEMKNKLTYSLVLKPRADFKGGNDVPIFKGDVTCVSESDSDISSALNYNYKVRHVNVPFSYKIRTRALTMTVDEITEKKNNNLSPYTENDLIAEYDNVPNEFTESISAVQVTGPNYTDSFSTAESAGIYIYTARLFVSPKQGQTGENSVGQPNASPVVVSSTSVVQVFSEVPIDVDGLNVSAVKNLEYNNGNYELTVDAGVSPGAMGRDAYVIEPITAGDDDKTYIPNTISYKYTGSNLNNNPSASFVTKTLNLASGYYYFEASGGDGGKGANYDYWGKPYPGGEGGKGGTVRGIIHLDSDKNIKLSVGYNGAEMKDYGGVLQSENKGGKGGGSTVIFVEGYGNIVVAGGASGGGKGYQGKGERLPGAVGNSSEGLNIYPMAGNEKIPDDDSIKKGNDGSSDNSGNQTEAVSNYIDTTYVVYTTPDGVILPSDVSIPDFNLPNRDSEITDASKLHYIENQAGGAVYIEKLAVEGGYQFFDGTGTLNEADKTVTDRIKNKLDGYIKDIELSAEFSQYFEYADTAANSITVTSPESDFNYDIVRADEKLVLKVGLPYRSYSENLNYHPIENDQSVTTKKYSYTISDNYKFQIKVKLKPKAGFLGGNDVPLLKVKKPEEITDDDEYMNESQTEMSIDHTGNTDDSSDDKGYVKRNNVTDWANVEIDFSGLEFEINDRTAVCGTNVKADEMIKIVKDPVETADASWKTEFVEYTKSITDKETSEVTGSEKRVFKDTDFLLSVSLSPKSQAQKAQVISSVKGRNFEQEAHVYVQYKVRYELDHLAVDRVSYKPPPDENGVIDPNYVIPYPVTLEDTFLISDISSENYTAEITPVSGYRLPRAASVSGVTGYTYANQGGKITISIPKENIKNNIVIKASALPVPHKVHYIYESSDSEKEIIFDDPNEYNRGSAITDMTAELEDKVADAPAGYKKYEWTWPENFYDSDGNLIADKVMGDEDIYVVGKYKQKVYTLTINYTGNATSGHGAGPAVNFLPDKYYKSPEGVVTDGKGVRTEYPLVLGSKYSVESPIIYNNQYYFFPDKAVVCGEITEDIEDENIVINVNYSQYPDFTVLIYKLYYDIYGNAVKSERFEENKVPTNTQYEFNKYLTHEEGYKTPIIERYRNNPKDTSGTGNLPRDRYLTSIAGQRAKNSFVDVYYLFYIHENADAEIEQKPDTGKKNNTDYKHLYHSPKMGSITPVTITYDANGGIADKSSRKAIPGKEYSFVPDENNPSDGKYAALPRAVRSGFVFDGWYTQKEGGELIDEEDSIVPSQDQILYAHWKSADIPIKINYIYADDVTNEMLRGEQIETNAEKNYPGTYNKGYIIKLPDIPYYEPEKIESNPKSAGNVRMEKDENGEFFVKGIAQQEIEITVYYSDLTVLTLNIYDSSEDYDYDHLNSGFALKGGEFELVAADGNIVAKTENTDGTITWTSKETVALARGQTYTLRCLSPPSGYQEYSEEITLDNFKNQKNVFLKMRFMLPFTGTTNQTIYYCVGAGIMLIAAVLLYITLKKEKRNDKD